MKKKGVFSTSPRLFRKSITLHYTKRKIHNISTHTNSRAIHFIVKKRSRSSVARAYGPRRASRGLRIRDSTLMRRDRRLYAPTNGPHSLSCSITASNFISFSLSPSFLLFFFIVRLSLSPKVWVDITVTCESYFFFNSIMNG